MTKTPDFFDPKIPQHERDILLSEILKIERGRLFLESYKISSAKQKKLKLWQDALKNGYPLQYLTKKAYFMNLELFVNENVLIPRPETELLAELALKQKARNILEVGVGSGCTIIYLATNQKGKFTGLDISERALSVAKLNAKKYNAEIKFIKSDLFEKVKNKKFDLIIANLPYGKKSQLKNVSFEPKNAIYGGRDGFEIIARFISNLATQLTTEGKAILEIDPSQSQLLKTTARKRGFNVEIIKDLNNRDRIGVLSFKKDRPQA